MSHDTALRQSKGAPLDPHSGAAYQWLVSPNTSLRDVIRLSSSTEQGFSMKRLLAISFASLFITLSACGPAEEEPQGDCSVDNDCKGDRICQEGSCVDPTSSNNSTTANNSTTMNNATSSNNQTAQPATCAQFCDKVVGCYPDQVTRADCESSCAQNVTQAVRDCAVSASTCADADACVESGGNNQPSNNQTNNDTSCLDAVQCENTEYCWQPEGAAEGTCQANDIGKSCSEESDCVYGFCLFNKSGDVAGECTRECTVDSECPGGWTCAEPPPTANYRAKRCIRQ